MKEETYYSAHGVARGNRFYLDDCKYVRTEPIYDEYGNADLYSDHARILGELVRSFNGTQPAYVREFSRLWEEHLKARETHPSKKSNAILKLANVIKAVAFKKQTLIGYTQLEMF